MKTIVARSAHSGIGYTEVDWETKDMGYVRVVTAKGGRYLVRVSNVVAAGSQGQEGE